MKKLTFILFIIREFNHELGSLRKRIGLFNALIGLLGPGEYTTDEGIRKKGNYFCYLTDFWRDKTK